MFNLDTEVGLSQHVLLHVGLLLKSHPNLTCPGTHARASIFLKPHLFHLSKLPEWDCVRSSVHMRVWEKRQMGVTCTMG